MREPNQPEDYLQRLRHSTAHIMAYAVQQLFPDGERTVKLAIGPPIENEFYYDMEVPRPLTPDDFPEIEKHMKAMIKRMCLLNRRPGPTTMHVNGSANETRNSNSN